MTRLFLLLATLAIASCGGSSKGETTGPKGGDPCGGDPCGGETAEPAAADFSGWASWVKLGTERHFSKGHGKSWVDVYAEQAHVDMYNAKGALYPVGARIAKAQYASKDATELLRVTVMAKMAPGYDAEYGDWYYALLDPSGSKTHEGKMKKCINCHDQVDDQDYIFGAPGK